MQNKNIKKVRVFQFKCADRVRTIGHGHIGTVMKKHHKCPMSQDWIDAQSIPINPANINKPWYSVSIDNGGSIVCEESDMQSI